MTRVLLPVLLLAVALGCRKPAEPAAAAPAPDTTPAVAETPAPKPVPDVLPDTIAVVNGDVIARSEFEHAIKAVEQRAGGPVPDDQRDTVLRSVLEDLVAYRLLKQEAIDRKVEVADGEVNERMDTLRQQFGTEAAFKKALGDQETTLDRLREDARADLAVAKLLDDEVTRHVAVSPSEISAFYEKNPDRFQQPEMVRASHVLVIIPPGSDDAAKAALRGRAEMALKAAKSGKDFAALAKQYSDDASAQRGGDLGFFPKSEMVPAFADVAFSLPPGQISEIVETQFGYHVIKVTGRQPARTVPFAEVTSQIEEFLEQQQRQTRAKAFVDALKARGKIEIFI